MKFLIDSCIAKFAVVALREEKYEVYWIPEYGEDPGDLAVIRKAYAENYILVTADKDFGELILIMHEPAPAIIRLVDIRTNEQGRVLLKLLGRYSDELKQKALITASHSKIRIRLNPR